MCGCRLLKKYKSVWGYLSSGAAMIAERCEQCVIHFHQHTQPVFQRCVVHKVVCSRHPASATHGADEFASRPQIYHFQTQLSQWSLLWFTIKNSHTMRPHQPRPSLRRRCFIGYIYLMCSEDCSLPLTHHLLNIGDLLWSSWRKPTQTEKI